MSRDDKAREKLARLADAVFEDIMEMSDFEILAEVDRADIERARTILVQVKMNASRQLLAKARAQHEAWAVSCAQRVIVVDSSSARDRFEKLRHGDSEFNQKVTMAARNGEAPSEADKQGLAEDWADLQRLDEEQSE